MEKKSAKVTLSSKVRKSDDKESVPAAESEMSPYKARAHCSTSESSSHTKFFRKDRHDDDYKLINRNEYHNISESISSSDTFRCVHGSEGKVYTQEGLLKRNFIKELDPTPVEHGWTEECPPLYGWAMASKIVFLLENKPEQQIDRLQDYLREFVKTSSSGYRVDTLENSERIISRLQESSHPAFKDLFVSLLRNLNKPILLKEASDVIKCFDDIAHFIMFMVYLLMCLDDDDYFNIVSEAVIWHLSAPDSVRGPGATPLRYSIASASIIIPPVVKMLAVSPSHRFPTFLKICLLLACDTEANCVEMMHGHIIENLFYRFNPYFPYKQLPLYEINPADCQDINLQLGDCSKHLSTVMSLLLVLMKTVKEYLANYPKCKPFPHPDACSQRCFIWAYRYECRARGHDHQRITLTTIAMGLLKCFGPKLTEFSNVLMPDVMALSVLTEVPARYGWIQTVNFNSMQQDAHFKTILIHFSVELLKAFPTNKFMVKSYYWLWGLMYLIDPGLHQLRAKWSQSLFSELRKTALQALVCALPLCDPDVVREYSMIRRVLWYIEWYTEFPFDISTLYWCVRLLQTTVYHRKNEVRETSITDLFHTHGIIILMHLCSTLLSQKLPPIEKSQAVLSLVLRLITSSLKKIGRRPLQCCVYPQLRWPVAINSLAKKMMTSILYSLENCYIVSDRWLISFLNFLWEGIVWRKDYREQFVKDDGVYNLLDLITMTRPAVQCVALALVCDIARAGDAVGQLVTWRARLGASTANPVLVKRGATISSLLAAVFYDECKRSGIRLDERGIIQDTEHPIRTSSTLEALKEQMLELQYFKSPRTKICLTAADMAGSRISKAFALLHMLSEDLADKVGVSDQAYHLYKDIKLDAKEETVLVLCSHYLTLKLNEIWAETKMENIELVHHDQVLLDEFLIVGKGWAKEIKQQQDDVIARDEKRESNKENSLYAFLGRIRLNIALDALREVRRVARTADRSRFNLALLQDAVHAHLRCFALSRKLQAPILRTYKSPLDDVNMIGQNVKVMSITEKSKRRPTLGDCVCNSQHK